MASGINQTNRANRFGPFGLTLLTPRSSNSKDASGSSRWSSGISAAAPQIFRCPAKNPWPERQHQHIPCRARQSNPPTRCLKADPPHLGTRSIHLGTIRAFALVAGLLSFRQNPRESALETGKTDGAKRKTDPRQVSKNDPRTGRWHNHQAVVSATTDQLSAPLTEQS